MTHHGVACIVKRSLLGPGDRNVHRLCYLDILILYASTAAAAAWSGVHSPIPCLQSAGQSCAADCAGSLPRYKEVRIPRQHCVQAPYPLCNVHPPPPPAPPPQASLLPLPPPTPPPPSPFPMQAGECDVSLLASNKAFTLLTT